MLVKFSVADGISSGRKFLPRLGAPIVHLSAEAGTDTLVTLEDNSECGLGLATMYCLGLANVFKRFFV